MNHALQILASAPEVEPLHVDSLSLPGGQTAWVVRDDLLPGGSKQRAVVPYLSDLKSAGIRRVTYASPFAGFAQVALSHGCARVGLACHIVAERDPGRAGLRPHEFTALAANWGARVTLAPSLAAATEGAEQAARRDEARLIPLGFSGTDFEWHFRRALVGCLEEMSRRRKTPRRIWLPVGSGTLARCLRAVAPSETALLCVDVGVLAPEDRRLQAIRALEGATYYQAPEAFAEAARASPPIPSNRHYDAKLWPFLQKFGRSGDLWWNVAR